MRKPLRGRRSGPLWFLILLIVGGGVYAAVSFAPGDLIGSFIQQAGATRWQATPDVTATAQPMVADTPTPAPVAGITPGSTPTPLPSDTSTPTPTPAPDFYQMINDFRRAERAALQTLDANVLAQLPVFAHGEALAAIQQQVETLRAAGHYEVLIVEIIQIEQVMPGSVVGVLVSERHSRQTFARDAAGDRLLAQEVNNFNVVYGFVEDNGRWKIDKVRITNTP